jgi:hypothetical protein
MEIAETGAARQQVAHMHVNGVKASAMEGRRHFNVKLSFDINDDVAAPYIATGARPKVAVLREQGVNSSAQAGLSRRRCICQVVSAHHMRSVVRLSLNTV